MQLVIHDHMTVLPLVIAVTAVDSKGASLHIMEKNKNVNIFAYMHLMLCRAVRGEKLKILFYLVLVV